jgi:hypothetical protein
MYYMYGSKPGVLQKLVATFDSEEQLLAYAGWATLRTLAGGTRKFEQGSALAGFCSWTKSSQPLSDEDPTSVIHNPSPSML